MRRYFADTFYFLALLNPRDAAHARAAAFTLTGMDRVLTSAWILTELADALANTSGRHLLPDLIADLRADPQVIVVEADRALWDEGISLYRQRPDKQWSLTDCTSFALMSRERVTDALTADHHFEQAGFNAMLR